MTENKLLDVGEFNRQRIATLTQDIEVINKSLKYVLKQISILKDIVEVLIKKDEST